MEISALLDMLHVAEQLKNNTRHSWTSSSRQESVAEHSWRLALMAYWVHDEFPEANREKLMLLSLIHDLGESFTGDIPAFVKTDDDRETEYTQLQQWTAALPQPYCSEMSELFQELEEQITLESKIVKALDKIEVLIQHNEADIDTWLPLEYEMNLTHANPQVQFSAYLKQLREAVRQDTLKKIAAAETQKRTED